MVNMVNTLKAPHVRMNFPNRFMLNITRKLNDGVFKLELCLLRYILMHRKNVYYIIVLVPVTENKQAIHPPRMCGYK